MRPTSSQTLRSVGRLVEVSRPRLTASSGHKIAEDFLRRWTASAARQCAEYIKAMGFEENPFSYGERQLAAFLLPALAQITPAVMPESSGMRQGGVYGRESLGRIDYWCNFEGVSFLVEVKRGVLALRSRSVRKELSEAWSVADEQVSGLSRQAREWVSERGAVCVSLAVVPFYYTVGRSGRQLLCAEERCLSGLERLSKSLHPRPNWECLWLLHSDLQGPYILDGNRLYPAVAFIARVGKVRKGLRS